MKNESITPQYLQYAKSLLKACSEPLIVIDISGKIVDANLAFEKVTGLPHNELVDTNFFEYFTEPNRAHKVYYEIFEKGFVLDIPLAIRHKNDSFSDILLHGSVYNDEYNDEAGALLIAKVTTRETPGSKYSRVLFEANLDPLIAVDRHGKITDVNKAFMIATGTSREDVLNSIVYKYFDDPVKACEVFKELHLKGFVIDHPLTLIDSNKKRSEILFNGTMGRDGDGVTMAIVVLKENINARELQAANYVRSLIEASLDPLITINTEGKITDVNKATIDVTHVSREKLIGSDFSIYFTEPDKARKAYKQIFEHGYITDFPLTILTGKLTDIFLNGSIYKDDRNNAVGVVVVARDVTLLKKKEKELLRANSKAEKAKIMAEEAMKAKQQFLSNMSHEIRTPMNSIIGFTKVLSKTELNAKQREYLSAIKLSGDTLIVLINDILDLAKVDAGKMTFEQTPFRLAESISAMLNLFEVKIQEKNLGLVKDFDPAIPKVLVGDPVRLRQIVLNLISNAAKFTSHGQITMSMSLLREDEKDVTVKFSVTDTGIGIPKNKLKSIFDNFEQASHETVRMYGGTGLGLSIVKKLVESQGGTVFVKSRLNKGSTFGFNLSFRKTKAHVKNDHDSEIIIDETAKDIRVLVAEDNTLNQLLMKTILGEYGFKRDIAANGKMAVEKLQKYNYDIILMDLQMPEMDGFEVTEFVRNKMKSDIPIIALTADVTQVDLEKCKVFGMNDYISKPVDDKLLYTKMMDLLKKVHSGRNIEVKK